MPKKTAALILAAGQGTRMRSALPKVLHLCAGVPLVCHVIQTAMDAGCAPVVVVVSPTNRADIEAAVRRAYPDSDIAFAVQEVPRGTGDAARAGLTHVPADVDDVVILCGDAPLLRQQTLLRMQEAAGSAALVLLSAKVAVPRGYGRVLRNSAQAVQQIVEEKDATEAQRAIQEINAGVYWGKAALLRDATANLKANNAQNELYLTDVVAVAAAAGGVQSVVLDDVAEAHGVNSRADLGRAEMLLRAYLVAEHQSRGVSFVAPDQVVLAPGVQIGQDTVVGPGVQLLGHCQIGSNVTIEGPSVLLNTKVADGAVIHSFCHLSGANVGGNTQVGPYARLRPEAILETGARVGNFVEIKKSRLRAGAKVNHLSYVGDSDVGAAANVGAGVITCNYDGFHKHQTLIGAGAFVGSNSTLVAPVQIGAQAIVAAGSAVTADVPANAVAFGRARQENRPERAPALREKLAADSKAGKHSH